MVLRFPSFVEAENLQSASLAHEFEKLPEVAHFSLDIVVGYVEVLEGSRDGAKVESL